jgi:hypothetical protein
MSGTESVQARTFLFLRNGEVEPVTVDWLTGIDGARQAISDALNAKNVAFLLGAGCSSLVVEDVERGIPTMAPLAKEFCNETLGAIAAGFYCSAGKVEAAADTNQGKDVVLEVLAEGQAGHEQQPAEMEPPPWRLTPEEVGCLDELGVDLEDGYSRNLERLMELLFSQRFVLQRSANAGHWPKLALVETIIRKVQQFLWTKVTAGLFAQGDHSVRDLYEMFYRKLVLRDRSLPRPWVFTTNYDVFNETAMDRLGIPYANGFSGVVERRFNPSTFRYALAEQFDVGSRQWGVIDAFVYLCKLHGSVSWTEDDHGLFPIRERWPAEDASKIMIYPTPAKQNASLASPYADLFREFQSRIVREQSVLITIGYAFGDQHINNIIYQGLTIPTFRLIVFASPDTPGEIAKLGALRDPRIWILGGDGPTQGSRAHYFNTVVEHFMPQRPSERIDEAVRKVLETMAPPGEADL